MNCKDCLSYEVCGRDLRKNFARIPIETVCYYFKPKDMVKVVRCKDCKHFTAGYCCRDIKGRSQMHYMGENAFCSYGEKKDGKGEGE